MSIQPIWHALARHTLMASVLAVGVALSCAIVCNMVFLIATDMARVGTASGVDEAHLVMLDSTFIATPASALAARHRQDLARLRQIPGVRAAVAVDALPLSQHDWTSSVSIEETGQMRKRAQASLYDGTPGELDALGLERIAGRDFRADEYVPMHAAQGYTGIDHVPAAIITQTLADKLFPPGQALGKSIYIGAGATRVVGIVRRLVRPTLTFDGQDQNAMLLPMVPDERRVTYVLRTASGRADSVLKAAVQALKSDAANRVIGHVRTFAQLRAHYFRRTGHTIGILVAACACLVLVTAVGIFGLASFWVQQRTRSIGVRRALGARRLDVLAYFQVENGLVVGLGVLAGMLAGVLLNLMLMHWFAVERLPWVYAVTGAVGFVVVGQLAVLSPALRASRVPPMVATRSV